MTGRFMKIMGLCLAVAFVMSAVAVATASATTPEFRFAAGSKVFSSVSGPGTLQQKSGATVKCTSDSDTGEIEGASGSKKARNVVVTFKGCTSTILTEVYKCKTATRNEEEIRTNNLEGELGYIKGIAPREVGLLLKPEAPATLYAEFECLKTGKPTVAIKVRGSIIGKIGPLNTLVEPSGTTKFFTLEYKKGANAGEPSVKKFENLPENKLETSVSIVNAGAFEESALAAEDKIFPLVSMEIRA